MGVEEDDDEPAEGVRRWLISCDESGIGGERFYGFGTLWMSWDRRGDFAALIAGLRKKHSLTWEFKWNKVANQTLAFYRDVVELFFSTNWLSFHCLVVEKAIVKKELHAGDFDLARRKHFAKLLQNKIQRRLRLEPKRQQTFRIWVDPIASRYEKADEVIAIVANRVLAKTFGGARSVDKVITKDSKTTPSIQLCDVLLGAVMDAWQRNATKEAKKDLQRWIAEHVGWNDLAADTKPGERKFNVWYFYDSDRGGREVVTRPVSLRYPLPSRHSTRTASGSSTAHRSGRKK